MNSKKAYFLLIAVLVILSGLVVGTVVGGSKMLKSQSQKLMDKKVENRVLEQQQAALLQAKKDTGKYNELEKIAKSIVPQDKDQAKAVRELVLLAGSEGIAIQTINFPTSNLGTGASTPSSSSGSSSGSTPASPSALAANPALSQLKPVQGISGVYQLDTVINSNPAYPVTFGQLTGFLARLENNRRTAQVTNIVIKPTSADNKLSFSVTVTLYIKP